MNRVSQSSFKVVILEISRRKDNENKGRYTQQQSITKNTGQENLTVSTAGLSVCLLVLIGLTSCMASVKGTASEM